MDDLKSLQIFQKPMCLISTTEDGKLQLEEEPLKQIEQIDMPLVIVAIAGLYRTGKSYLMNCLAGETKGFPLGNTTESKTKGIWAWCKIHPKKDSQVLLLLDTEGLGDIAKGNTDHDNKIFTIAALLCNVLVYNMMSAFNQDAVEKLTFISEISKNISFASGERKKDEKFDLILPLFVLCLRDFILDIEKDGTELSTDEYLEDCLELKPGKGKEIDRFNRPRECLRQYFPKRKCFTFDRPGSKKVMKKLETATAEQLSEDFREETEKFLKYIYECKPKVLLSSKPVRGKMFATLACSYINAISSGAIPDVDDAIQTVAKMENERMANAAVEEFKAKMETVKLPVLRINDFNKLYQDIQNASLAHFRSEAMFDPEQFEKRAINEMDTLWKQKKERNSALIKEYCVGQLKEVYGKIVEAKKQKGEYFVSGGYEAYREDMRKVKQQYEKKTTETDVFEGKRSFNEFIDEEADFEIEVMMKDRKLSEEDRKKEIEKIMKDNQEAYNKQQLLFEQKMAEEKQQTEEHYKKLESERETYIKREEEKLELLMKQWEEQKKLNELTIQMMKTENEKQRNDFKEEIKELNETNRKREKENMERFDRKIEQEREMLKTDNEKQRADFKEEMKQLNETNMKREKENNETMKDMQAIFQSQLQYQAEERKLAEERLENERRRYDEIQRSRLAEAQANAQQSKMEAIEATNQAYQSRIDAEVAVNQAYQSSIDADEAVNQAYQSRVDAEALKNRGLISRVFNSDP